MGFLNAGGAYDARHEVALSFGGQGSAGDMDNLFVYDAYANRLERLEAANPPGPAGRHGHLLRLPGRLPGRRSAASTAMTRGPGSTAIARIAGRRTNSILIRRAKMQGEYSTIPVMAYDSVNNVCLLVAWLGDKGHETWALDMNALRWRKLDPSVEPLRAGAVRGTFPMIPTLNVFILESWRHEDKPEIWTYRYRKATATTRPAPPTELTVTTSAEGAALAWQPSPTRGVTYHICRAETEKPWLAEFAEVGATSGTTFEDRGLAPGKVYLYSVLAVAEDGGKSAPSRTARTQPRVSEKVTVSAKALDRVEVQWQPSTAPDVVGYNVYRALATIATNTTMAGSWAHNDPPYDEPVVDAITDLTCLTRLNAQPIREAGFVDAKVDLKRKAPESADYRYAVYAYFVRAVNQLGVESGPSPYALTIPSEPKHLLLREKDGKAELHWSAAAESSVVLGTASTAFPSATSSESRPIRSRRRTSPTRAPSGRASSWSVWMRSDRRGSLRRQPGAARATQASTRESGTSRGVSWRLRGSRGDRAQQCRPRRRLAGAPPATTRPGSNCKIHPGERIAISAALLVRPARLGRGR